MPADPEAPPETASPDERKRSWARNTVTRFASAGVLIPLVLWLLYAGPAWGWVAFCYFGIVVASGELMGMVVPASRPLQGLGVLSTVGLLSIILWAPERDALMAGLIGATLLGLLGVLARPEPVESAAKRAAWLIAGPVYLALTLSPVALMHRLEHGGSWVVLAMVFAFGSDTAAYFAGSLLKGPKLYPLVSPNKTISGAVGGLVGAALGAVVAHFWFLEALPLVDGILLAVVAGALGQAGDLCVSLLKRSTGVKDTGKIMPGHGGLLDRIDAFAFTASATWLYASHLLDQ